MIQLGDIAIHRITEWEMPFLHLDELFPSVAADDLDNYRDSLLTCPETGKLVFSFHSFLVVTPRHTLLIDTCIGCDKSDDWIAQWHRSSDTMWLQNLERAGAAVEDIDYVFCTHLHLDHCGWNTRLIDGNWVPTFPNARYLFAAEEYRSALENADQAFDENVRPIATSGQMQLVDSDYVLDDHVWLEATPGHTPGHVVVHLQSRGKHAVMWGDLLHSPIQCCRPEWSTRFDWDAELAARTRSRFLATHAERDSLMLTAHFPSPSIGHVRHSGDGFEFDYQEEDTA